MSSLQQIASFYNTKLCSVSLLSSKSNHMTRQNKMSLLQKWTSSIQDVISYVII